MYTTILSLLTKQKLRVICTFTQVIQFLATLHVQMSHNNRTFVLEEVP